MMRSEAGYREPAVGVAAWRASKVLAVLCFVLASLFAVGSVSELRWRINLRRGTVSPQGYVVAHRAAGLSTYPTVAFTDDQGTLVRREASDSFTRWTVPPIGASVEVRYDPAASQRVLVRPRRGIAVVEWLALPAVLAFLILVMLSLGARLLLV